MVPDSPPSPYDPHPPPLGWGESYSGPPGRLGGWDDVLCHSLLHISRDERSCGTLCLCAIEFRGDGRFSLADPRAPPGGSFGTTPDRRRPRAPAVAPQPPRRLPCVGHATYGSVLVPYRHLEPGSFYEALHSMRRVCSCDPPWVRSYHVDMGWGSYADRPYVCGCPWRHGEYRPELPLWVIDHVGPDYEPSVRPMDRFRAERYPDDPEVVDNPDQVGLFLGAPQLRSSGPIYFPASAPAGPSVVIGASASSSGASSLFPPGGDWQGIIGHLPEGRGAGAGGGRRRDDGGHPHARPGGAPGQSYPVSPGATHREGPREGAPYAYRGTIVGEATRPGPSGPRVGTQSGPPATGRRWNLIGPREDDPSHSSRGDRLRLARWASRGVPAAGRCLPAVGVVPLAPVGVGPSPWTGEARLRPARWASPGVCTGVLLSACIGQVRVRALATATGGSSLVRPPIRGLFPPVLTFQALRRRGRFSGTCARRLGPGQACRGGAVIARAEGGELRGPADGRFSVGAHSSVPVAADPPFPGGGCWRSWERVFSPGGYRTNGPEPRAPAGLRQCVWRRALRPRRGCWWGRQPLQCRFRRRV